MMVTLTMLYAWMLEIALMVGHHFSNGKWPAPLKYLVVAVVAISATIYKFKLPKGHSAYVRTLSRSPLTCGQVALMACFIMGWVALFVWLAIGPPGPEFAPA